MGSKSQIESIFSCSLLSGEFRVLIDNQGCALIRSLPLAVLTRVPYRG
jgi:hypothetical protein